MSIVLEETRVDRSYNLRAFPRQKTSTVSLNSLKVLEKIVNIVLSGLRV